MCLSAAVGQVCKDMEASILEQYWEEEQTNRCVIMDEEQKKKIAAT